MRDAARRPLLATALALACAVAPGGARAEDPRPAAEQADRLRATGDAHVGRGEWAAALQKYAEAVAAWEAVLGQDSPDLPRRLLPFRRAMAWCRVKSGDPAGVRDDVAPFYRALLAVGGDPAAEDAMRGCVATALHQLALRKDVAGLDAVYPAFREAVAACLAGARADRGRALALAPMVARLEVASLAGRRDYLARLCVAGQPERGIQEYRALVQEQEARKELEPASWTASDAFYEITRVGRTDGAAFFLLETLKAVKRYRFARVERYLSFNLANGLERLRADRKLAEAVALVTETLAAARSADAFGRGLDEGYFRWCLAQLLAEQGDWDKGAANGDALAAWGKAAGSPYHEALGAQFAGDALAALGRYEEAVPRFDAAIERAQGIADLLRFGYAAIAKGEALTALTRFDAAESACRRALEVFEAARYGPGLTAARVAARRNAEAGQDGKRRAEYERQLAAVAAAGGLAGRSAGTMEPAEMERRIGAEPAAFDLLEVTRAGNRLVIKNLVDGSSVEDEIGFGFHCVNVSGILFEIQGAELVAIDSLGTRKAPGGAGEIAFSMGGQVTHTGPQLRPFRARQFVDAGCAVRVTSALQTYRVRK